MPCLLCCTVSLDFSFTFCPNTCILLLNDDRPAHPWASPPAEPPVCVSEASAHRAHFSRRVRTRVGSRWLQRGRRGRGGLQRRCRRRRLQRHRRAGARGRQRRRHALQAATFRRRRRRRRRRAARNRRWLRRGAAGQRWRAGPAGHTSKRSQQAVALRTAAASVAPLCGCSAMPQRSVPRHGRRGLGRPGSLGKQLGRSLCGRGREAGVGLGLGKVRVDPRQHVGLRGRRGSVGGLWVEQRKQLRPKLQPYAGGGLL